MSLGLMSEILRVLNDSQTASRLHKTIAQPKSGMQKVAVKHDSLLTDPRTSELAKHARKRAVKHRGTENQTQYEGR